MTSFSAFIVCMLYHEGKSPEYIAKHLRTSVSTIEALLQKHYTGESPCTH
jgi:transposase